ncbi:Helicase associated domain protein [Streptomyces sp. cg28]|uniref:DEAD/DEAH box helicase n=1 Tax=Streptomyces sp. cg28 TaxID=3403457 RepID=UPI003B21FD17
MTTSNLAPDLWPHQREAIDAALHTMAGTGRTTVVLPCGTGKTRVGSEIGQQVAGRVLVVEPTIELVGQTLHAWRQAHGKDALGRTVALCSDPDVMDQRGQELRTDQTAVTTSPVELTELTSVDGRVTVVSTYAGMRVLAEAHANGLRPWDLIVIDEAHRTAGAAGKAWAQIHDDVVLPAARRLYLTATPRIAADRGEAGRGNLAISMDDGKVYGPICYKMPFSRAAELGLLADYQVVIAVTTDAQVRALAAERQHYQVGRSAVSVDMLARQIAVLRAAEQHHIRRMISFHSRIEDARWFAKTLPAVAPLLSEAGSPATSVWAGHVHGGQRVAERRKVLDRLRGEDAGLVVVANARVLTEGVDAPAVDGIAFLDPRESVIDIIQALGRAMRRGGQKDKIASIVVPVLLGPGEDPVEALEGSAYQQVWRIARALRAHDEALGDRLDRARLRLGSGSNTRGAGPSREMPDWLTVTGIEVPPGFAAAISARAVRTTTSSWEEHYGAATQYRQTHGNLLIPQTHVSSAGLKLGERLARQRAAFLAGELRAGRKERLDDLGIVWSPRTEEWERNLSAAQAYFKEFGHLRVPSGHVTAGKDPVELGSFIRLARAKSIHLDDQRKKALDAIGMVWSVHEDSWQRHITAARKYRKTHGDLLVPKGYVTSDEPPVQLGSWINWVRTTRTPHAPERRKELDGLGMVWSVHEYKWQRSLAAARTFYTLNNHLQVPVAHTTAGPDPIRLGRWISKQRALLRDGSLSPERAAALTKIGMQW